MTAGVASFSSRRAALLARMEPGSVAFLATAPESVRNGDSEYPYRHDSSFYYLTGFPEPESALALVAANGDQPARAILFCREKNPEREIWDGLRHGPEAAQAGFGVDAAYPVGQLDEKMAELLAGAPALYCRLTRDEELDQQLRRWFGAVRARGRTGITAPPALRDLVPLDD